MIGWGLLIVSLVLAAIHSPWWLAATTILALWKAQRWYFYKSSPWRRVHYPMMRAYAAVAGLESGNAEREHRQFDVKTALTNLVESVHPEWTRDQATRFVDREFERCRLRSDSACIKAHLLKKNPKADAQKLQSLVDEAMKAFDPSDKGLMTRMVIGGIVEERFGEFARGEYLMAVLTNEAK